MAVGQKRVANKTYGQSKNRPKSGGPRVFFLNHCQIIRPKEKKTYIHHSSFLPSLQASLVLLPELMPFLSISNAFDSIHLREQKEAQSANPVEVVHQVVHPKSPAKGRSLRQRKRLDFGVVNVYLVLYTEIYIYISYNWVF